MIINLWLIILSIPLLILFLVEVEALGFLGFFNPGVEDLVALVASRIPAVSVWGVGGTVGCGGDDDDDDDGDVLISVVGSASFLFLFLPCPFFLDISSSFFRCSSSIPMIIYM